MKVYSTYKQLKSEAPLAVFTDIDNIIRNGTDTRFEGEVNNINFEEYFGGDVYLIENYEDLKEIYTAQISKINGECWANVTETADGFDDARYIAVGSYVVIFMATTDAGGATYYIPRAIADECPNIEESIKLTDHCWNPDDGEH